AAIGPRGDDEGVLEIRPLHSGGPVDPPELEGPLGAGVEDLGLLDDEDPETGELAGDPPPELQLDAARGQEVVEGVRDQVAGAVDEDHVAIPPYGPRAVHRD